MSRPGENSPGSARASSSGGSSSISTVDQLGGVLGDVRILGEHRGDRLADVAHLVRGQHRLAVRRELLDRPFAEIDRPDVVDVARGPHRDHAGQRAGLAGVDRDDAAVRVVGAHHRACEAGARN